MKKQMEQKATMAVLIIVSILAIGIFTIGCDNDTTDDTANNGYSFPESPTHFDIWRMEGVSEGQMSKILGFISDVYNETGWGNTVKNSFENKVVTIKVYPDNRLNFIATEKILEIGCNNSYNDVLDHMAGIAMGTIIGQKESQNYIRLAFISVKEKTLNMENNIFKIIV
jgi:hypothetical protein